MYSFNNVSRVETIKPHINIPSMRSYIIRVTELDHAYTNSYPFQNVYSRRSVKKNYQGLFRGSSHNELEKNRRAHLRYCLDQLHNILPANNEFQKHTTLSLLTNAKKYIENRLHILKVQNVIKRKLLLQKSIMKCKLNLLLKIFKRKRSIIIKLPYLMETIQFRKFDVDLLFDQIKTNIFQFVHNIETNYISFKTNLVEYSSNVTIPVSITQKDDCKKYLVNIILDKNTLINLVNNSNYNQVNKFIQTCIQELFKLLEQGDTKLNVVIKSNDWKFMRASPYIRLPVIVDLKKVFNLLEMLMERSHVIDNVAKIIKG
ncbi:Max-interacting transcriptional repressor MAD3 [Intoshia linei]|uniref:Max-interacting transcriptional repressor MAD3 n=1 Tax=Intoshia linei TaxID=1819745 RepID=A0A177AW71_9BILA|nr:Max-interacting transcriptional repressor MAD3 [Intoshia linei]